MSRQFDPRQVQRAFSSAATSYDEAAELQREVARRLLERLDTAKQIEPGRVLDVGAGTGEVTRWLRQRFRRSQLLALDPAPGMLALNRKRAGWWRPWRCLQARAEKIPLPDGSVDLVFSNLALQWCNDLASTVGELHRVLTSDGLFLGSTFGPGTLGELRQSWAAVSDARHVNDFDRLDQVGDALHSAGLRDVVVDVETLTLLYEEPRALLRELKAIGAHNVNPGRPSGLTGRRRLQGMLDAYGQFRTEDGLWPASYEVIYASGWR